MYTDRILHLALKMAGLDTVPEETHVYVPGEITKALVCIDADTGLLQIDNTVPEYSEARRLIRFLDYFLPVMDIDVIPSTSIIREFLGNSFFDY